MKTLLSFTLLLFVFFTSCNSTKTTTMTTQDLTGSYTVKTLKGKTIRTVHPKFSFDEKEKTINGNTGCNSFFGNFSVENDAIHFSQMGVSEMYCSEEGIMDLEREFLDALNNTQKVTLKDKVIYFYSESGEKLLEADQGVTR